MNHILKLSQQVSRSIRTEVQKRRVEKKKRLIYSSSLWFVGFTETERRGRGNIVNPIGDLSLS